MSFWRPTLVTNSPLAFKFISLLSKARKNKKLLPPPLDKNGVFGIFYITYFGLYLHAQNTLYLHAQSARRRAGRATPGAVAPRAVTLAHKARRWTQRACFAQSLLPRCTRFGRKAHMTGCRGPWGRSILKMNF